jgi:hypothetical protein
MPRRKPTSARPDPATTALLQTLNPHAAGIDIGATELWVCVPPSTVASPLLAIPGVPTACPPCPQLRRLHSRPTRHRCLVASVPGDDGGHGIDRRVLDPAV